MLPSASFSPKVSLESVAHAFESDEPGRDALEVLEGPDDLGDARHARIGRIAPGHGVAERLLLREKLLARARAKLGERRVLLVLIVHVVVVVLVGVVGVGYGPLVLGGGRPVPSRRDVLRLAMFDVVATILATVVDSTVTTCRPLIELCCSLLGGAGEPRLAGSWYTGRRTCEHVTAVSAVTRRCSWSDN